MGYPNGSVSQGKKPLFSFGVITDVQYADIPDGRSFLGVPRYYRNNKRKEERERIYTSGGSVCESDDEPGVSRIRASIDETPEGPGLALSRAFGDFFVKYFGLISEPDVIQRTLTTCDRLVILATDGVWDVVSNDKAVEIVSSSVDERDESEKRLVEYAAPQWKCKRPGFATDDISVVCIFFNNPSSSQD